MTSLTEVYDGSAREVASPRRLYAGTSLVLVGAVLAVAAVLVATTDLFSGSAAAISPGMDAHYASIRLAGVLAGFGVPTALVGVFLVLPAGRRVQAAAAIGVTLCLLGVVLFWDAYPHDWRHYGADHTLRVSAVYLLGLFTALWSLFTAVVNFKTRNDPGGALEMNVTRENTTVVEVTDSETEDAGGLGGIGFLGSTPDGEVETQTNADADESGATLSYDEHSTGSSSRQSTGSSSSSSTGTHSSGGRSGTGGPGRVAPGAGAATSDGGTAASDISSPMEVGDGRDAEIVESSTADAASEPQAPTDRYCGNCEHFEYVRSSEGMVPYCARHEAAMDDMDACEEWTPNRR